MPRSIPRILIAVVAALALGAFPAYYGAGSLSSGAHVDAQGPCPAESARAAEIIEWFLTAEAVPDYKARVGLTDVGPGDARLLGSATDDAACEALNDIFAGSIASEVDGQRTDDLAYYDVGGRYVVVTSFRRLVGSEFTMTGLESVDTFDRSFTHLTGIGF